MSTIETTVAELLTSYQRNVHALRTVADSIDDLPPVAVAAALIRAAMMYADENSVCPACLRDMLGNAQAILATAHRDDDGPGLDDRDDDDDIGPTAGEA